MKAEDSKKFLTMGFVSGIIATLLISGVVRTYKNTQSQNIAAEVQGETLTMETLKKDMANDLVPVQNDEYRILKRGVDEWFNSRLLEKEARAQKVSLDELYRKEIWSRVNVTYSDAVQFYNQNRGLFDRPFEEVNSLITEELRRREYNRIKDEYLESLRNKYKAAIHLKQPESYVEGFDLPYVLTGQAPEIVADQPAAPPSRPSPAAAPPAPSAVVTFDDLEGRPSLGPKDAAVTLVEFSDFHCPFCARVTPTLEDLMKNYPGKIRRVWRHFPLSMHPGAERTHEASECAFEQGKFWEYHDQLFATIGGDRSDSALTALAKQVGLDTKKFDQCLTSGKYKNLIQQEIQKGEAVGVQGTPMVFVNGQEVAGAYPYDHFDNLVQSILTGRAPQPAAQPQAAPEAAPSPGAIVQFDDLEGRPSQGPKNAQVTVVEFSDFHCPFCAKVSPTVEQLMKAYEGKIRRVWRHFPLPFHTGADRTHAASECAFEQGKFWQYHDKLFATLGGDRSDPALVDLAKQTGLDTKKFEQCLTSGKYNNLIQKEMAAGSRAGVDGTPTLFINGQMVAGAYPYEHFQGLVEGVLNPGKAQPPAPSARPAAPPPPAAVQFDDLEGKPSQGPKNASVVLIEFSDFHCPFCARVTPTIEQLMKNYDGKIRRVWRHFPLSMHRGADRTHEASQCAFEEGKFWEYHDKLFQTLGGARDDASLIQLAKQVGINEGKFKKCLESGKYKDLIQQEISSGSRAGVRGTPAFFVNGKLVSGAQPYASFDRIVQSELKANS
ncbi:MAG TPA: thioredoxin domain-containing protein [bacterium]|nr:thioredoxin domain-containing protein [bacterium]